MSDIQPNIQLTAQEKIQFQTQSVDRPDAQEEPKKITIREDLEQREHLFLSPYAAFSDSTKGRDRWEEPCDIRPAYQRDRDRILHSKAFRRLKGKTQVFLSPEGDHYRTRMTHTLEVAQTARTLAKALRLNEDLTEAIAMGHDLGHTPFGHAGERALNEVCPLKFEHQVQSVRVVERLEKGGNGLNLTKEVRDGILNHQTKGMPSTLEGKIVRMSDKIAYINSDIDDAVRGQIILESDIPRDIAQILGRSVRERLNTVIHDIVITSEGTNDVRMSEEVEIAMTELRKFLFANVYTNPTAKGQEGKAEKMVKDLYYYYAEHQELLPMEYSYMINVQHEAPERVVCDYVAGMTDRFAIQKYSELNIPYAWSVY